MDNVDSFLEILTHVDTHYQIKTKSLDNGSTMVYSKSFIGLAVIDKDVELAMKRFMRLFGLSTTVVEMILLTSEYRKFLEAGNTDEDAITALSKPYKKMASKRENVFG